MKSPQPQRVNRYELDEDPYRGFQDCVDKSMTMLGMVYLERIITLQKEEIQSLRDQVTILTKAEPKTARKTVSRGGEDGPARSEDNDEHSQ